MGLLTLRAIAIDTMGRHKAIAVRLVSPGGDRLFGLKGNKDARYKSVIDLIEDIISLKSIKDRFASKVFGSGVELYGGRRERRIVPAPFLIIDNAVKYGPERAAWDGIKSLAKVERRVDARVAKGERVRATPRRAEAPHIARLDLEPEARRATILGHGASRRSHGRLDATFPEDKGRLFLRGPRREALSTMRRPALDVLGSIRLFRPKVSLGDPHRAVQAPCHLPEGRSSTGRPTATLV
jgi:hypothetical protein